MEYSLSNGTKGTAKTRKHLRLTQGTQIVPPVKSIGCPKCGCKRRHARTCTLKKKGEDEEDPAYTPTTKEPLSPPKVESTASTSTNANAGSLFCYQKELRRTCLLRTANIFGGTSHCELVERHKNSRVMDLARMK